MISKIIARNLIFLKFLSNIVSHKNIKLILTYYFRRYIKKIKIPAVAYLGMTFECQFSCEYCGVATYPLNHRQLSIDEWKGVIDQLITFGVPRIHFSGGEPLLREGINELIRYTSRKGAVTFLETNGWDLSYECIVNLKKNHLDAICISLDDAEAKSHDKWCKKPGSFSRVIKAIEISRSKKIVCVISTIVRRELILSGGLVKILSLAKKLKVYGVRLISPHPMGRWLAKEEEILSIQEKIEVKKITNLTSVPILGEGPYERTCRAADNYSVFISPYGEVQPCGYIPYSFGNVRYNNIDSTLKYLSSHKMFAEKSGCKIEDINFRNKYINTIVPASDIPIKLYSVNK